MTQLKKKKKREEEEEEYLVNYEISAKIKSE